MSDHVRGTRGYAEAADHLFACYESYSFEATHGPLTDFIPRAPGRVLDIGAGTGRDAAWYAEAGFETLAVEPCDALRMRAMAHHTSPNITWCDDSLPGLESFGELTGEFDLIQLSAVWMHLDREERAAAMPRISGLLKPGGRLIMLVRLGPVPEGRCMFDVPSEETVALADAAGLMSLFREQRQSAGEANRKAGVTWMNHVFEKER
ncbi:bifunctional 2-polyprenyl-6-hydroxyphenol methylase/3-demethylubiquinol 3-O-methyltransferase UbiG [Henriciella sp.]|uniref:class I SAM-dependent methyltransferase n=1 Tax=Henriciella sp. TaxID=1968823 RepID=UPI002601FD65|nr:class I SAM-dependent methyltransferase [Henriciella sp.]